MNYAVRFHLPRRLRHRSGEAGRGFTLIELLVVIGIIALLISILLPTLRRIRHQARLADCASRLHSLGAGIMAYAMDNDGRYPYRNSVAAQSYAEPYFLSTPNGAIDNRPLYRKYLQNINYLQCALTPDEFDIEQVPSSKAILTGYEIWAGGQFVTNDARTNMYRIGQRPLYNRRRFAVLAADIERWVPSYAGVGRINSGHPDYDKLVPLVSTPPTYEADPTAAYSMYANPRAMARSPIDRNFLMDDGSVQLLARLEMRDGRTAEVPYYPHDVSWGYGWLPPVE